MARPSTSTSSAISPASGSATETVPGTQTSYTWTDLANAVGPYTFTVVAHNVDGVGPVSANSNAVYAHGTPARPSAPTASGAVSTDQKSTTITVTWPEITECNDAQPCASYTVTELSGSSVVTTATVTGGQCGASATTCTASFGPLTNTGAGYTYTLTATNHEGDVSTASAPSAPTVYAAGYPDQITDLSLAPGDTEIQATFTLPPSNAAGISMVKYNVNGVTGSWANPGSSGQKVTETIPGRTNAISYSVTVWACSESAGGTSGGCGQPSIRLRRFLTARLTRPACRPARAELPLSIPGAAAAITAVRSARTTSASIASAAVRTTRRQAPHQFHTDAVAPVTPLLALSWTQLVSRVPPAVARRARWRAKAR